MKPYLLSAALGLLVGVIYALFNVRSPAPPVIALVGLLGILAGEQIPPLVRHLFAADAAPGAFLDRQVRPHVFGALPGRFPAAPTASPAMSATDIDPAIAVRSAPAARPAARGNRDVA